MESHSPAAFSFEPSAKKRPRQSSLPGAFRQAVITWPAGEYTSGHRDHRPGGKGATLRRSASVPRSCHQAEKFILSAALELLSIVAEAQEKSPQRYGPRAGGF
jgi:hypothetical protein